MPAISSSLLLCLVLVIPCLPAWGNDLVQRCAQAGELTQHIAQARDSGVPLTAALAIYAADLQSPDPSLRAMAEWNRHVTLLVYKYPLATPTEACRTVEMKCIAQGNQ